jgi:SAM-dependent methyltransferase
MLSRIYRGLSCRIRWRLGMRVAAPELETGGQDGVRRFYQGRVTDCGFLSDPDHYERPRVQWILDRVAQLVALDASTPSLAEVARLNLPNVTTVEALVEEYRPEQSFDGIVLSEVLEHLRSPHQVVKRLVELLSPGGSLLITTPHGHWESNEHLQEFSFESFCQIVSSTDAEAVSVAYLRDSVGRRRWLVAQVTAPLTPPAPDDFNSRLVIAGQRRRAKA